MQVATGRLARVRVRGIYATALTKMLMDLGYQIVQPSRVIAERFRIPQLGLPADVTVKNSDNDPAELVVVGYEPQARDVVEKLKTRLGYSFYWLSKLPLHATVKARIVGYEDGACIAEVNGVKAEVVALEKEECQSGREIIASVVRPAVKPLERARLTLGARVIGDYAILIESNKPSVTVSEHVRDARKRAELAAIATEYTSKGYSVHWRSSSQHADRDTLRQHLAELEEKLRRVKEEAAKGKPGIYSVGELVAVIRLSSSDKELLDSIRNTVVPTVRLHHTVKSMAPTYSKIVDYAEKLLAKNVDEKKLSETLLELIIDDMLEKRRIGIVHVKPTGEVIELGRAELKNVMRTEGKTTLILERKVRSSGIYDGLNIPKEPGDTIITEVTFNEWTIIHKYYNSNGELKGTYINVNTPPEPSENVIVYLDLEVDIVKLPGQKPKVIDLDKLEEAHRRGIIPDQLYSKAIEVVKEYTT